MISGITPDLFVSKVESLPEFLNVIYQVQATIITLGIAIVAIFSGALNEEIYGLSVPNYILQHRPVRLKHKYTVATLIILLIVGYILISFEQYNLMISCFLISIILILYMTLEVFSFFNGRESIRKEINAYLLKNYDDNNLLSILFGSIRASIDREESIVYRENMTMLIALLSLNDENIANNDNVKEFWEQNLSSIFKESFSKFRGSNLKIVFTYFDDVYKIITENLTNMNEFNLWDDLNREFFDAMRFYEVDEISELYVFTSIRWKLYSCQRYSVEDNVAQRNNHSVEYIFNRVYNLITREIEKYMNLSKGEVSRKIIDYYKYIKSDVYTSSQKEYQPILLNEFRQFTKLLIDSQEEKAIKNTLIQDINTLSERDYSNDLIAAHWFSMIIYVYFLSEKSTTISKELKKFSRQIFDQIKHGVSDFLHMKSFAGPYTEDLVNNIKENLDWWEHIPEDQAIINSLESFIDQYLLFSIMYLEKGFGSLLPSINAIVQRNIFSFVNQYTGIGKKKYYDVYHQFISDNYNVDYVQKDIEKDFELLENILFSLYIEHEKREGAQHLVTLEVIQSHERQLKERIQTQIFPTFECLNNNAIDAESFKRIKQIRISTYTQFLDSTILDLNETLKSYLVSDMIRLLIEEGKIVYKDVHNRDKNALNILFDMLTLYEINTDTLLGYRDWFTGFDNSEKFHEMEKESKCIKSSHISDIVTCLDSESFSVNSLDCNVSIDDMNFDDFKKHLKTNNEGKYLYNVTNDIYLPFEEEELRELISNTRKIIIVDLIYNYSFIEDIVGIAVIFKAKKQLEDETYSDR